MSISGASSFNSRPASSGTAHGKSPKAAKTSIASKAKQALAKGIQDGGPVTDVKPSSDHSGKTGDNDYYSALGYDDLG